MNWKWLLIGIAWLILGVWFVVGVALLPGLAMLVLGVAWLAYAIRRSRSHT